MNTKEIGSLGERIAQKYLKNKGYQILDKNYSFRIPGSPQKGEIDIVAKKDDIISFIEAKTLTYRERFSVILPEDKVDVPKQRKTMKAAESWLMKNKIPLDSKWQIDVVSITVNLDSKKARIRHFQNI